MGQFADLVPRLWPFFRHGMSSVRAAVLQTLDKLLTTAPDVAGPFSLSITLLLLLLVLECLFPTFVLPSSSSCSPGWLPVVLAPLARSVLQNMLVEERADLVKLSESVRVGPTG